MYSLLCQGLAGIQPVDLPGIENVSSLFLIFFILFVFHAFITLYITNEPSIVFTG